MPARIARCSMAATWRGAARAAWLLDSAHASLAATRRDLIMADESSDAGWENWYGLAAYAQRGSSAQARRSLMTGWPSPTHCPTCQRFHWVTMTSRVATGMGKRTGRCMAGVWVEFLSARHC